MKEGAGDSNEIINMENEKNTLKEYLDYLIYAGAKAGMALPMQPVARIMVAQQHSGENVIKACQSIKKGGFRNFFTGTLSSMTREGFKALYKGWFMVKAQDYSNQHFSNSFVRSLLAASIVGVCDPAFVIDRYRTFLMTRPPMEKLHFLKFIDLLYQNSSKGNPSKTRQLAHFIPNLFEGFCLSSIKQVSTLTLFFVTNESMKARSSTNETWMQKLSGILVPAGAAMVGGAPFDVLITRKQAEIGNKKSFRTLLKNIREDKGMIGLSRGLLPKTILTIFGYSATAVFLNYRQNKSEDALCKEFNKLSIK